MRTNMRTKELPGKKFNCLESELFLKTSITLSGPSLNRSTISLVLIPCLRTISTKLSDRKKSRKKSVLKCVR